MVDSNPQQDSRVYPRIQIFATALVTNKDRFIGIYNVENLSAGGALLVGCQCIPKGTKLVLLLDFPRHFIIKIDAKVLQQVTASEGKTNIAVSFYNISADTEDQIQDAVLDHLYKQRKLKNSSVLILDDCLEVRHALKRELKTLNRNAVLAPMSLDAIRLLSDREIKIDTAFIDLKLGPESGMDFIRFMKKHYPNIKRILFSGEVRSCQLELAKSKGYADFVISKPWHHDQIKAVLAA